MLYSEYMDKVKDVSILQDEETNQYYIRPDYKHAIYNAKLELGDVSDFSKATDESVYQELVLEKDMRNMKNNKIPFLLDWLYDVLTTTVNPAITQEENELVKDAILYRQTKASSNEVQNKIKDIVPGLNFAKKEP